MVVVNYFPGSFGDRIIAEISGLPYDVDELDIYHLGYPDDLKRPQFYYEKSFEEQHQVFETILKPWLVNNKVLGGHRCLQYDFKKLNQNLTIISINPENVDPAILVNTFNVKVYSQFGHYNSNIQMALDKITETQRASFFARELSDWANKNILPSDIVLDLALALSDRDYLESFRKFFI